MKNRIALLLLFAVFAMASAQEQAVRYEPVWESIKTKEIPDWALDAKFGIYAHWGPYSFVGAWEENQNYPNVGNYYTVGYRGFYKGESSDPRRQGLVRRYGPMNEGHGYIDLCKDFKVEGFDPVQWANLVAESGAKYAGMAVVHHDGYLLWDSELTPLCAGKLGANRDIVAELYTEFEKRGLKTLATFHHARTKGFWNGFANNCNKNPELNGADLVRPEYEKYWWWKGPETFAERRLAFTKEFINKYEPDAIWFDGGGQKDDPNEILAEFFNMGLDANKEVCLHNKWAQFGEELGLYGFERGRGRNNDVNWPFEDDITSSVGPNWSWWHGIRYKKPEDIIRRLCHVTAMGGGLLLSLNPRPDGSFDQAMIDQLKGIGAWLEQNEEAIHGTRPWKILGEGHVDAKELRLYYIYNTVNSRWDIPNPEEKLRYYSEDPSAKMREYSPNVRKFDHTDIRFTTGSSNTLYAIQLHIPDYFGRTYVKSLGHQTQVGSKNMIKSVELLGHGPVEFERTNEELIIQHPPNLPNEIALAFKITVEGELERKLHKGER